MRKRLCGIILCIVMIGSFTSCAKLNVSDDMLETSNTQTLDREFKTDADLEDFKSTLRDFSLGESTYTNRQIESVLEDFLSKLDDEAEKDECVKYYIDGIESYGRDILYKMDGVMEELREFGLENEETELIYDNFKDLPEEFSTLKGFVKELEVKGYILKKDTEIEDRVYVTMDMDKILEKYGKYLNESSKKFYELEIYEDNHILDSEGHVDIDELAKKIILVEEGFKIDKEYGYSSVDRWTSAFEYYYEILLGANYPQTIDDNEEDDRIYSDEVINKYKEIIKEYEGTELSKNLSGFVARLEKGEDETTIGYLYFDELVDAFIESSDIEMQEALIQKYGY